MEQLVAAALLVVGILLIGLLFMSFIHGVGLAFKRNWFAALFLLVFLFPVFFAWVGIELLLEKDEEEE